ncbi:MAG: membrane dipeptidase [Planctomycetaceae bacterium]
MLIFDAHLDLAWNALEWNRDLLQPVSAIREFERQFPGCVPGEMTTSVPALRDGNIGIVIATLLPRFSRPEVPRTFYQSRHAAFAAMQGQLAWYRSMVELGHFAELSDVSALNDHVATWQNSGAADTAPIGFILSMEGSWAIPDPSYVERWYNMGLRILGPAHYGPDDYGHGTGSTGGLKDKGPALLKEMDRVGMLLDVTHLSDDCFWQSLDIYTGPVLASHHNCRELVPGDRQLTNEQIRALLQREAVIGLAFDSWMIRPGWIRGKTDPGTVCLADAVNHIDHICQLAGTTRHCGIGSDLDGGFGKEQSPCDLDTIADLQKIADLLSERNYSDSDIAGIMHGNWIDFFRRAWQAS